MSDTPTHPHFAKLQAILVEHLGVEPAQVTPEAALEDDLGADSLDQIEIVMAVEEHFRVMITDDEAEGCETVADILALIDQLMPATTEAAA